MKAVQFDAIARASARRTSRRGVMRSLGGGVLVALGTGRPARQVSATSLDLMRNGLDDFHPVQDSGQWEVAFGDSFDGAELASEIWRTRFPWGRDRSSVGEGQWYVRDYYQVADSRLRIVADRCAVPPETGQEYCSGLISTHDSFAQEYGYFEIRARVPYGQGLWPAFWMLPLDGSSGEIDVFEILGHDPTTVHMNVHYVNEQGEEQSRSGSFSGPDFSLDYHTFAVDWTPEAMVWYIDGVERHWVERDVAIPSGPYYLIANLAVGGDWPGYPDATTPFPAFFDIDYIVVSRR
jgi:beta-glucanase (GH16 family)